MKKIISLHKKIVFTFLSLVSIVGYGYFVYAAAPTGGYTPGSTLDPHCAPGSTDCTVTFASGGTISIGDLIGSADANSILYTNGDGELTVDSLFTRDSSTKETQIMRSFNGVGTSEITVTTKPIFANLENGAIFPFQEGESFTTTPAGVTGTIVRVENQTIGQAQGMETTPVFSGTGPNDLSIGPDDYSEQDPRNFTVTITHKDLPYASVSMSGSPFIPGETITGQNSGSTAQIVYADYTYVVLENIVGIFDSNEFVTSDSSSGNLSITGGTTDMITVNNTDTTVAMPIIVTGNTAINGVYVYFSSPLGHEIGDQWAFTVSYGFPQFTVLYLDNVSGASVSTDGYSIVGTSSGQTMNGVLYIPPLGAVGDTVRMFNVSDFNQITGSGIITAINDGVYTISGTGSPNASDVIMNMSDNNDGNLSFVYSATSEETPSLVSTGFVSSNNILGLGVKGTGLVQSNNNSGVFSGVYDASSFGGSELSIASSYFGSNNELAQVTIYGGVNPTVAISSSTNSGDGFFTISPTSFSLETRQNGNTLYGFEADTSTIGWRSGNERYFLPTTMPNNGDVLSVTNINGNEITLGFTTSGGGGSSSISVNGTTLYSSGLTGTSDYSGNNIFLGNFAGNGVNNVYNSNFLGSNAGQGATNASNSNFLGQSAGYGATGAYNSNFLGSSAGQYATSAYNSNFLGSGAGNGATNASNSNFLGYDAGGNATNASYSNFSGWFAGRNATNAYNSNFLGQSAGNGATDAYNSIFIGTEAGYQAINANRSIFIGPYAGYGDTVNNSSGGTSILIGYNTSTGGYSNSIAIGAGATNTASNQFLVGDSYTKWSIRGISYTMPSADGTLGQVLSTDGAGNLSWSTGGGSSSPISINGTTLYSSGLTGTSNYDGNNIFFGNNAGNGVNNVYYSNFLGYTAGQDAIDAAYSNFFGYAAGISASGAYNSNFFGQNAGNAAAAAYQSNFFGKNAGSAATNAYQSNFFGYDAGYYANGAYGSNFLGNAAGYNATNAYYSNFLGNEAGSGATDAIYSNFLGVSAGINATNAANSNFLGSSAGQNATNAQYSNFFGVSAGYGATNANNSNFLGQSAGNGATDAYNSNFLGQSAGYGATGASNSNFLGVNAGISATGAYNSNFLGSEAGYGATDANNSNFLGSSAGQNAVNARNSIFIGNSAGYGDTVNNSSGGTSILIGDNTSTGGYSNSIAIGAYATNTASNQFMIGSATRPINDLTIVGTGFASCTIDIPSGTDATGGTGTGISCSSDERLKTNIEDLESTTLDTLLNVKTVRYNWNANPTGNKSIGFLAQDLQQYFPELVKTGHDGYLQVNYGGITPILVEAIREMNLKITTINDMTTPNTWRDSLIAWFGNVENGIVKFFAGEIETKKLCIADDAGDKTCITKAQLDQLLMNTTNGSVIVPSSSPEPAPQDSPSDDSVDPSTDTPVPASDTEDTTVSTPDTSSDPVPSDTESVPDTGESSTATE